MEIPIYYSQQDKLKFEIFKNHAPIISNLDKGIIRVTNIDNKSEKYDVNGGVIEMQNNKIIILVD